MRERLIATLVGLTIAVISLYGVPRAYFLADLVRDNTQAQLDDAATLMSVSIRERTAAGGEVDAELLGVALSPADSVTYVPADGEPVSVGRADTDSGRAVTVTRHLADGSELELTASASRVQDETWDAVLPLVVLGLALAALAAVIGYLVARRLSRPFRELADSARMLGHGNFDVEIPTYAVTEADAIGTSLRQTGARLEQLVRREREFAANASHQLRTPITALRLQLEDLTMWPDTSPEISEELVLGLAELDRLSMSIDDLLGLARGQQLGQQIDVDLAALVAMTAGRWRIILGDTGRDLSAETDHVVPARLAPGPVNQLLDVLIDNAFTHGAGRITVSTRDVGTHLEVRVSDEGTTELTNDVFHRGVTTRVEAEGHGVGLAVASELAELVGGHLSIDRTAPTTTFVLWLPRPTDPASPSR